MSNNKKDTGKVFERGYYTKQKSFDDFVNFCIKNKLLNCKKYDDFIEFAYQYHVNFVNGKDDIEAFYPKIYEVVQFGDDAYEISFSDFLWVRNEKTRKYEIVVRDTKTINKIYTYKEMREKINHLSRIKEIGEPKRENYISFLKMFLSRKFWES